MKVREFIIQVLLLSIKDRYSDNINSLSLMFPDSSLFPDPALVKNAFIVDYQSAYLRLKEAIYVNEESPSAYPKRDDFTSGNLDIFKSDKDANKHKFSNALVLLDESHDKAYLRDKYLKTFLGPINSGFGSISSMNPAFIAKSLSIADLQYDETVMSSFFDLSEGNFSTIFRAEYKRSNVSSWTLQYFGASNFFTCSQYSDACGDPQYFTYNASTKKMYMYPVLKSGSVIVFGKTFFDKFTDLDDEIPSYMSSTFLSYAEFFIGKVICTKYNSPWEAQKESILMEYKKAVSSENNTNSDENFEGIKDGDYLHNGLNRRYL